MIESLNGRMQRLANKAPMLSPDEERDLIRRHQAGERGALDKLVVSHLRLVVSIASKMKAKGVPMDDLVNEGAAALVKVADRFDLDQPVRFATYAMWHVRVAIRDAALGGGLIRIPCSKPGRDALYGRNGAVAPSYVPLDKPIMKDEGATDMTIGDLIEADEPGPHEILEEAEAETNRRVTVAEALSFLSERERVILRSRIMAERAATLDGLGATLGISKERVRQIESRALEKLRKRIEPQMAAFA